MLFLKLFYVFAPTLIYLHCNDKEWKRSYLAVSCFCLLKLKINFRRRSVLQLVLFLLADWKFSIFAFNAYIQFYFVVPHQLISICRSIFKLLEKGVCYNKMGRSLLVCVLLYFLHQWQLFQMLFYSNFSIPRSYNYHGFFGAMLIRWCIDLLSFHFCGLSCNVWYWLAYLELKLRSSVTLDLTSFC